MKSTNVKHIPGIMTSYPLYVTCNDCRGKGIVFLRSHTGAKTMQCFTCKGLGKLKVDGGPHAEPWGV